MVNRDRLKEVLNYNCDTGIFTWIKTSKTAGTTHSKGYTVIQVDGKVYKAHRLAWLYMYGGKLPEQIDHINRIRNDNRISNLRASTNEMNQKNRHIGKNNTSGIKGVYFHKKKKKWISRININKKMIQLGSFDSFEDAVESRFEAEEKYGYDYSAFNRAERLIKRMEGIK